MADSTHGQKKPGSDGAGKVKLTEAISVMAYTAAGLKGHLCDHLMQPDGKMHWQAVVGSHGRHRFIGDKVYLKPGLGAVGGYKENVLARVSGVPIPHARDQSYEVTTLITSFFKDPCCGFLK